MKRFFYIFAVSFHAVLFYGCASYPATEISNEYVDIRSERIRALEKEHSVLLPMVRILSVDAESYYLDAVDSLKGASRSEYERDHAIIRAAVRREASFIYVNGKPATRRGVRVLPDTDEDESFNDVKEKGSFSNLLKFKKYYSKVRVYQYVNWSELCLLVFPIPRSTNESVCVTAELYDAKTKKLIEKYEGWGYNKTSGFRIWDVTHPNIGRVRQYVIRKTLGKMFRDVYDMADR